jgi:hypothetical protein
MSTSLDVEANGRQLRFNDNFRVQLLGDDGQPVQEGDWESLSGENENEISFRLPNETRTSLAVKYTFNKRNQLGVQVVKQQGVKTESKVWALPGKILVNDLEDLEYQLLDETGELTDRKMFVYAKLNFPDATNELQVTFPDETTTIITGASKRRSLKAADYFAGGDLARDLLVFTAVTTNNVDGDPEDMPADIAFHGRWDMHENGLVFVTKYDNTVAGERPTAYLAFAGKFKGTNVGLVLEQDGAAVLTVNGKYEWNRNTLAWDLRIGHSQAAGVEVRMGGKAKFETKKGTLAFEGAVSLTKGPQAAKFDLDLKISYTTKGGKFLFTLDVDQGGYDVQLTGDFKIRGGSVRFELRASDRNGAKSPVAAIEFGRYDENSQLKASLNAVLGPSGVKLELNLTFEFYWGPKGPVAKLP